MLTPGLSEQFIRVDEARLTDRRAHLDVVDVFRPRLESERLDPCGDGAGGDENDFMAGRPEFAELGDEFTERGAIGTARFRGEGVGTYFDDYAHGIYSV